MGTNGSQPQSLISVIPAREGSGKAFAHRPHLENLAGAGARELHLGRYPGDPRDLETRRLRLPSEEGGAHQREVSDSTSLTPALSQLERGHYPDPSSP